MPAEWNIQHWPPLGYHVFLSHCAEDRDRLVRPVHARLQKLPLIPWFDQDDYPLSSDPYFALREHLIRCRHVIYFITPALLNQGRGWCAAERAYSQLIQCHFEYLSTSLWSFELPLIFLPRTDVSERVVGRSVWGPLLPRAKWLDIDVSLTPARGISLIVAEIKRLVQQQVNEATLLESRLRKDASLKQHLERVAGLRERVSSVFPVTK